MDNPAGGSTEMVTASSSSHRNVGGVLPSSASYASSTSTVEAPSSLASSTATLTSSASAMVVAGEIGDGDSDFDDVEEDWRTRMVEGRELADLTSREQAVQNVINGEWRFFLSRNRLTVFLGNG